MYTVNTGGIIMLIRYVFSVGDIVDLKVNGAVQKGLVDHQSHPC